MKRRVLIFSLAYYPHVGGAEVAIKEIADRISRDDISFDMVTLRFHHSDAPVEMCGNVQVYRVALGGSYLGKALFPFVAAVRAYRLHRKNRYDGWWAMMSYMLIPIALLRLVGVRLPNILSLQEGDTYGHMFHRLHILPFVPLINYGFRSASAVQTISTYLGGWARKRGFRGPLTVIPNGVDVKKFEGAPIPHTGVVLVTASRLVHKNAVDDIVRALPLLPTDVRLHVCGTGPEERKLRMLAAELGVGDRIVWRGYVGHEHLPKELHSADIFIRPSRSEGMGNAFVEAMAATLPVIGTQVGGIADFLFDRVRNPERPPTGWAVSVGEPKEIAEAVRRILDNDAATKETVENAKQMVVARYDWNQIAHAMQGQFFKIIPS